MKLTEMRDYAEEHFDDPDAVLAEILLEIIDKQGWSYGTTLAQAVSTHSRLMTKKLEAYGKQYG